MTPNPSLFPQITERYFAKFVGKVTELINGKPIEQQHYFKQFLSEEFSVNHQWNSTSFNESIVGADIVAIDSSIPLKSRGAISTASGDIPKLAIGYQKGAKFLNEIRTMINNGMLPSDIASKFLDDVPRAIKGIDVALEIQFLQALSTGVALIPVDGKTGVRANFGYKDEHSMNAKKKWETTNVATPISDIQGMLDKAEADGVSIELITISKKYLNFLRASAEGKQLAAQYRGAVITSKADLPVPSRSVMIEALKDELGVDVILIDSNLKVEKEDGTTVNVSAYEEDRIVALPSRNIGRVVYGRVLEKDMPTPGITYADAGNYTLVSKYSVVGKPIVEYTTAEAIAIPVIDNGSQVYMIKASQE